MTDTEWTKEYIEHRDRVAELTANCYHGKFNTINHREHRRTYETFIGGFNEGATYERERAKVLVEFLKGLKLKAYRQYQDHIVDEIDEALAKYGETGEL